MTRMAMTFALLLSLNAPTFAHEYKVADLVIDHPIARATPVNAPVSGGYMTITNMGAEADRLLSASVEFAGEAQIHDMAMEGDVMKMRELETGIEIPAGGKVVLQPGGLHLMFMKLNGQLMEGEIYKAVLTFEKAGPIEVELKVETLAQIQKRLGGGMEMDHSGHSDMKNGKMEMPKAN